MENDNDWYVSKLMGSIAVEQQLQIIGGTSENCNSVGGRAIILSTDVVESSITIPECEIVVDTLYHKRMRSVENSREKLLKLELITKDEALQRCGRTGRTRPGKVY